MVTTPTEPNLALLRLLHLVSPSLPIGAFTYSQGIEWAVEAGWITDEASVVAWLEGLADTGLARVDIPILARLYDACGRDDRKALSHWTRTLVACRETAELRAEERNRGRALASLLTNLDLPGAAERSSTLSESQLAGFAWAARHWGIALPDCALGYAWAWLENLVLATVKIIPLGQTAGQRVLHGLTPRLPVAVETGLSVKDEDIGAASPALAIGSSRHETQYTRLFRS